jgi:Ni,Fe-hydrogenase III large subunit
VLSRFQLRAQEVAESVELVDGLVAGIDPAAVRADRVGARPVRSGEPASGVGISEGWRGTIVHRVELDADGLLTRVKVVDPSFFNWPALPVALADTIVPDFPLVNKSFNLSYAGNDL